MGCFQGGDLGCPVVSLLASITGNPGGGFRLAPGILQIPGRLLSPLLQLLRFLLQRQSLLSQAIELVFLCDRFVASRAVGWDNDKVPAAARFDFLAEPTATEELSGLGVAAKGEEGQLDLVPGLGSRVPGLIEYVDGPGRQITQNLLTLLGCPAQLIGRLGGENLGVDPEQLFNLLRHGTSQLVECPDDQGGFAQGRHSSSLLGVSGSAQLLGEGVALGDETVSWGGIERLETVQVGFLCQGSPPVPADRNGRLRTE